MSKSRDKTKSDSDYNARRRYYRAAQRHLEKSENMTGASAEHEKRLAKIELENALKTYNQSSSQKISKPIQDIAKQLDVNVKEYRAELKQTQTEAQRANTIKSSKKSLESVSADDRKEREAQLLFNKTNVGSRIIAGTVSIWREKATSYKTDENGNIRSYIDKEKILPALFNYFKVDNLHGLIEKFDKRIGEALYKMGEGEFYETVKLMIQNAIADNTLTA